METEKIPTYLVEINESDDGSGVFAMSFVESPAIERSFVALSKQEIKLAKDSYKQILTGPALIPDKPIIRINEYIYHISHK